MTKLIIVADDYGLGRSYDEGILEVARAGAVDAVSAFSMRPGLRPEPLLETGVEVGLHLDLAAPFDAPRADDDARERAGADIWIQYERFIRHFGRPPAYLDGHHHCHARPGLGTVLADVAIALGLPVRSIDPRHRRLLRCRGVATPDLLLGRLDERARALPEELALGAGRLRGLETVEWMVHPGHADPSSGSSYDAGREQDLGLLLEFEPPPGLLRATHAEALLGAVGG